MRGAGIQTEWPGPVGSMYARSLDGSIQTLPNPGPFVFIYVRKERLFLSSSQVDLARYEVQERIGRGNAAAGWPSRCLRMKVRELIQLVENDGWRLVRTRGSHRQFRHPAKAGTVTIAGKANLEIPPGTLNSILKQAGLKELR
jgi:predicted RNA binding protein YcfA (HicA-like mRNA interferase family)